MTDLSARLAVFARLMEAEWYNGNMDEGAYLRLNADLTGLVANYLPAAPAEGLREAAEAVVDAVDAAFHWHKVHEQNNPDHRCGFAAGYTFNVNLKERVAALRAALTPEDDR